MIFLLLSFNIPSAGIHFPLTIVLLHFFFILLVAFTLDSAYKKLEKELEQERREKQKLEKEAKQREEDLKQLEKVSSKESAFVDFIFPLPLCCSLP